MKSVIKIVVCILIINVSLFAKEVMFDLNEQDFQNSLGNKQLKTKYNVNDKVIIETNLLKSEQGIYQTNANVIGSFNIFTNQTIFDWKLNFDVQYEGLKEFNRFLKFTDINGEVILFELNTAGFIFNSIDYKANLDKKHLLIQIVKAEEKVKMYLNKQLIDSQEVTFDKLKSIETTFLKYNVYEQDKLNHILLISHD